MMQNAIRTNLIFLTLLLSLFGTREIVSSNILAVNALQKYMYVPTEELLLDRFCVFHETSYLLTDVANDSEWVNTNNLIPFFYHFPSNNCIAILDDLQIRINKSPEPRIIDLFWYAVVQMEFGNTSEVVEIVDAIDAQPFFVRRLEQAYAENRLAQFEKLLAVVVRSNAVFEFIDKEVRTLYSTGSTSEAQNLIEIYLIHLPEDDLKSYQILSLSYRLKKQYREAADTIALAISKYPNDVYIIRERYETEMETGQYQAAVMTAIQLANSNSDPKRDYLKVAAAYRQLGEYDSALTWIDRVLQIDNAWWAAYKDLGILACEQGDHNAALQAFEKALDFEPYQINTMMAKMDCLHQMGMTDVAIQLAKEATEYHQNQPVVIHIYVRLVQWYREIGNPAEAAKLLQDGLHRWPETDLLLALNE